MKKIQIIMKIKNLLMIAFLLFSNLAMLNAQNNEHDSKTGIQFFKGTWEEALALAEKENKPIFLDVYAVWCGPCKALKRNTFPNLEVGNYFNENFINVTLDGEKGDGLKVARELKVRAYPSLYILNASGKPIVYYAGYLRPKEFLELGKAGLEQLK